MHAAHRVLPDLVPASRLRSADALAVADRLFAAEATWHQGNNLAQTVFTCLYLLQPDRCQLGPDSRLTCQWLHPHH